ncbi:MAG: ABC transporter ATP-binding protein [Myxococcota bacterium]|nr:ABC transporter ATP-binding protein [Myxococcota bacterium]
MSSIDRIREPGTLLEVRDLHTQFSGPAGPVRAADGVGFDIEGGGALVLIGEAGAGKTAIALSVLRLLPGPAGQVVAGRILLDGVDLLRIGRRAMDGIRGARIGYVSSDPARALDPLVRVGQQVLDALGRRRARTRAELASRVEELLLDVGVDPGRGLLRAHPRSLPLVVRQRIVIAIAIAADPELVVADDPVRALDPIAAARIVELLARLREQRRHAQLLTSRDPALAVAVAARAAVLYAGRIVEMAAADSLFDLPRHPYSQLLWRVQTGLRSQEGEGSEILSGEPPTPGRLPRGCPFEPRCPLAHEPCPAAYPPEIRVSARHVAACWLLEE